MQSSNFSGHKAVYAHDAEWNVSLSPTLYLLLLPRSMTDCDTRHGHGSVEAADGQRQARLLGETIAAAPNGRILGPKSDCVNKKWANHVSEYEYVQFSVQIVLTRKTLGNGHKFQFRS